jgi:hypothetical protein
MSPLALLYVLFASSPLLNNWHHESTSPSTWNAMPFEHESFEHYSPSANWGEEKNTFEPEHLNWLLRKAVRSTEYPTSIRSIIAEMTGRRFFNNEEPRMFETESMLLSPVVRKNVVHMIRRIAEVNPIMIEKILSCPITRKYVKKIVRSVEPETLYQIEKVVRKNVPTMIREKVSNWIFIIYNICLNCDFFISKDRPPRPQEPADQVRLRRAPLDHVRDVPDRVHLRRVPPLQR